MLITPCINTLESELVTESRLNNPKTLPESASDASCHDTNRNCRKKSSLKLFNPPDSCTFEVFASCMSRLFHGENKNQRYRCDLLYTEGFLLSSLPNMTRLEPFKSYCCGFTKTQRKIDNGCNQLINYSIRKKDVLSSCHERGTKNKF